MNKTLASIAVAASVFIAACSGAQTKRWEKGAVEITDAGCVIFHDVEPAPVQTLCDYEHQILPFLERTLAAKGNVSVGARASASASASAASPVVRAPSLDEVVPPPEPSAAPASPKPTASAKPAASAAKKK